MNWRIKGVVQKVLSALPWGYRVNSALQLKLGGLRRFEETVDAKVIADWLVVVSHLRTLTHPIAGRTFMEIGTGWFPTLPVCFSLAGAERCLTYDLTPLINWQLTQRMLRRLEQHLPAIAEATGASRESVHSAWRELAATKSMHQFLERARIEYRAPGDACRTGLPAESVDIVFSNSVLEHVDERIIGALMRETGRVLKRGGLAIHSVNCGDHYAYFDAGVTQIHYLRFSSRAWRLWNNSIQYQNRLRADDFVRIAEDNGLRIVLNVQRPRPELLARFDEFPIATDFRRYSREQLCTTSVDFVAGVPEAR
jgi:SAM-dependent methyltransferase